MSVLPLHRAVLSFSFLVWKQRCVSASGVANIEAAASARDWWGWEALVGWDWVPQARAPLDFPLLPLLGLP